MRAAACLVGCLAVGLAACSRPAPLPEPPTETRLVEVRYDAPGIAAYAATASVAGTTATGADVTLKNGEASPVVVKAPVTEWDLRARRATFSGGVVVTRADVTLKCAAIDVQYADAEHVDTVTARGGVTVTRGAQEAHADNAVLVGKTGEITLTGSPSLRDGPNQLVGVRIVLHLDDERVSCTGEGDHPCRLEIAGSALPR